MAARKKASETKEVDFGMGDNPFEEPGERDLTTIEGLRKAWREDIRGLVVPRTGRNKNFGNTYFKYDDLMMAFDLTLRPKGWYIDRWWTEEVDPVGDKLYFKITKYLKICNENSELWIETPHNVHMIDIERFDDQKIAGHLTYYWRRWLTMMFDLYEDDDDGNSADIKVAPKQEPAEEDPRDTAPVVKQRTWSR